MRDFQIYHLETFIHFLPLNPGGNSRSNGVFRKEVTCQGHVTGISVNRQLLNPNHKKKKKIWAESLHPLSCCSADNTSGNHCLWFTGSLTQWLMDQENKDKWAYVLHNCGTTINTSLNLKIPRLSEKILHRFIFQQPRAAVIEIKALKM